MNPTTTSDPDTSDPTTTNPESVQRSAPSRRVGWAILGISVIPIWVSVVRTVQRGIWPFHDSALTVSAARDVFSVHPPLIGMSAAAARVSGYDAHFPGAWQLYAIAGPTEVLGNLWGPLVAMAALNTLWIVLAGWLLLRRLPIGQAVLGIVFLSALGWAIGGSYLVTPVPKQMLLVPFAALLVAAWCMADGDRWAIPVVAVIANYVWLDHLTLVLSVPVLVGCALVGMAFELRRDARDDPGGARLRRRGLRRPVIVAAVISLVMWLPPLIQQFTASPGNLRLLIGSSGADRTSVGSWSRAFDWVGSVLVRPPFWLRSTMDDPAYLRDRIGPDVVPGLSAYVLLAMVGVLALGVVLGVAAHRRRDRTGLWALIVAAVAIVAGIVTTYLAPVLLGPPVDYLRPLTCVGMFTWFALGINLVRTAASSVPLVDRWQNRGSTVLALGAIMVVLTAANFQIAPSGYGADTRTPHLAAEMNATVVPALADRGTVMVTRDSSLYARVFAPALILGLSSAGVDVCKPKDVADPHVGPPACRDDVETRAHVAVRAGDVPDSPTTLFRSSKLRPDEYREFKRLRSTIASWAESEKQGALTPAAQQLLDKYAEDGPAKVSLLADGSVDWETIKLYTYLWYWNDDAPDTAMFEDDPLTASEWRQWGKLSRHHRTLVVTEIP